jgi:hypothetical protein
MAGMCDRRRALLLLFVVCVFVGCKKPAPPVSRLRPSGTRGLLGAPLPVGVKVADQRAADPVAGGDSVEYYLITATKTDIIGYFERAMVADGWVIEEADARTYRLFRKGEKKLGVLTDIDGGKFSLNTSYAPGE